MYILIITLYSVIGVSHPVVLHNDPVKDHQYSSYGECQKAGEQIQDWLVQDYMRVQYECRRIQP